MRQLHAGATYAGTFLRIECSQLLKPQVVADRNANLAPLCNKEINQSTVITGFPPKEGIPLPPFILLLTSITCIKSQELIPRTESFRFLESDLARYVNVKEVHL